MRLQYLSGHIRTVPACGRGYDNTCICLLIHIRTVPEGHMQVLSYPLPQAGTGLIKPNTLNFQCLIFDELKLIQNLNEENFYC